MSETIFRIAAAFALDFAAGDPRWMPHPVRLIGRVIAALEETLARLLGRTRLAGLCLAGIAVGGAYMATWAALLAAGTIDRRLALGLSVYFLYTSFAARDLDRHATRVYFALEKNDLAGARENLALMVGRDTGGLSEKEVIRAATESTAEGTVDGVLAPMFFAAVGGAPLAMAYKAANTLDSAVGHRSEKYLRIGWASARLDDALNYIPARLARIFYPAAALVCGLSAGGCWRISVRDGAKSPSPNAAISEAALAGALGIRLGGTNVYGGVPEERPHLGDPLREPERRDIRRAVLWMYASSALGLLFMMGIMIGTGFLMNMGAVRTIFSG
ncbi:MAG TPA: cobalamin biosynthesis protein CobD [Nitrospinae bacterium]|nr:cobalamin biosynthesis protein CobD [Nitrospinota bacterium]